MVVLDFDIVQDFAKAMSGYKGLNERETLSRTKGGLGVPSLIIDIIAESRSIDDRQRDPNALLLEL